MTRKNALAALGLVLAASAAACSYLVDADRSKVSDTLYQPTPMEGGASDGSMGDDGATEGGDGATGDGSAMDGSTTDGTASETGSDGSPGGDAEPADASGG